MSKPKILLLSSNPRRDLNLDREISDLNTAVKRLGTFEIDLGLGARPQELPELLAEHKPEIVHFCGHGAGEQGLVFQDENGREQLVSTEILARIFKTFSNKVNCAVLNACDSDHQAEAIAEHINYAVGMSQPILDKAAYHFAVGFYKGLAAGESIEHAYEMGCIAIQLWSASHPQVAQSKQHRQLKYIGDAAQPAQPQLAEHLKPILRKNRMLPAGIAISSSPQVLSAPTKPTQAFVEYMEREIDRKEYKDAARDAYDNFGQFSAQNAVSPMKSECEQRKILLSKVKEFWIEGFLKPSLQGGVAISLDRKGHPNAISAPQRTKAQGIEALSVELDESYDELQFTQIREEMGQGRTLLVLGDPGAGKSIALLQLAQRLIERSEQNLTLPMPIVFNLSSWAKDRKSIVDWLIDELREKYQVPQSLSKPWINEQQLILLLDGLDEVKEEYRNACVRTLNDFIRLFPQTEMAVCSRIQDYEALSERLQISSALCLKPFSSEQVHQFLDNVGGSLAGLKTLIERDAELEQFAQNPLILNLMSVAYQGWSAEALMPELCSTADRHRHVFDAYIDRRLERNATSEYSKSRVLHWLHWLASRMVQDKQTIFLIEKMQPTWLRDRSEEKTYRIGAFIVSALIVGLSIGLVLPIALVITGLSDPGTELIGGLVTGLSAGLISGLITSLPKEISPLEQLNWSWQRAKSRLIQDLLTGAGCGLLLGLLFGLIGVLLFGTESLSGLQELTLFFVLAFALIFGMGSGLGSSEIVQRTVPNQGIRTSLKSCLCSGLILALISGVIFGLLMGANNGALAGLIGGLMAGPMAGLKYGGAACIQHFNLRRLLHKQGRIPQNYAKFLDFAADRFLMKKVGGGYVFFHRMLLEHFARTDRSTVSTPVIPESTSRSTAKTDAPINLRLSKAANGSHTAPQPANLIQKQRFCGNCGHANSTDGKFCTNCGKPLTP